MESRSVSTSHETLADIALNAQENRGLEHVQFVTMSLVNTSNPHSPNKDLQNTKGSNAGTRKPLHIIDNNLPTKSLPNHTLSKQPVVPNSQREVKKAQNLRRQASEPIEVFKEDNAFGQELLTYRKRSATASVDDARTRADSNSQSRYKESENLAWMDMMLALLEKRYGTNYTLPVCLSELEAANLFQLTQRKKIKTGIVSTKFLLKPDAKKIHTSADGVFGTSNNCIGVTKSHQIPAIRQHEQEQRKESKRQRLLLRYAQQIQVSGVSSSTTCGCKTGCLKMYCMCFSSRGFCHEGCACEECKNNPKNQTERVEAIQNYLANDPRAFSFASLPHDANADFLHLLPQKSSAVIMRGCSCKKSKCLKKYCECFQNDIACTSHCRCIDCSNQCEAFHLKDKSSVPTHDKRVQSGSAKASVLRFKSFHPVQITVTKQPRRNLVRKTLRLNL